jgi:5,10-methylene-tetrahydrofolate dehydrogenase/methenyl tetrahydrofolate cyclohydrolase
MDRIKELIRGQRVLYIGSAITVGTPLISSLLLTVDSIL